MVYKRMRAAEQQHISTISPDEVAADGLPTDALEIANDNAPAMEKGVATNDNHVPAIEVGQVANDNSPEENAKTFSQGPRVSESEMMVALHSAQHHIIEQKDVTASIANQNEARAGLGLPLIEDARPDVPPQFEAVADTYRAYKASLEAFYEAKKNALITERSKGGMQSMLERMRVLSRGEGEEEQALALAEAERSHQWRELAKGILEASGDQSPEARVEMLNELYNSSFLEEQERIRAIELEVRAEHPGAREKIGEFLQPASEYWQSLPPERRKLIAKIGMTGAVATGGALTGGLLGAVGAAAIFQFKSFTGISQKIAELSKVGAEKVGQTVSGVFEKRDQSARGTLAERSSIELSNAESVEMQAEYARRFDAFLRAYQDASLERNSAERRHELYAKLAEKFTQTGLSVGGHMATGGAIGAGFDTAFGANVAEAADPSAIAEAQQSASQAAERLAGGSSRLEELSARLRGVSEQTDQILSGEDPGTPLAEPSAAVQEAEERAAVHVEGLTAGISELERARSGISAVNEEARAHIQALTEDSEAPLGLQGTGGVGEEKLTTAEILQKEGEARAERIARLRAMNDERSRLGISRHEPSTETSQAVSEETLAPSYSDESPVLEQSGIDGGAPSSALIEDQPAGVTEQGEQVESVPPVPTETVPPLVEEHPVEAPAPANEAVESIEPTLEMPSFDKMDAGMALSILREQTAGLTEHIKEQLASADDSAHAELIKAELVEEARPILEDVLMFRSGVALETVPLGNVQPESALLGANMRLRDIVGVMEELSPSSSGLLIEGSDISLDEYVRGEIIGPAKIEALRRLEEGSRFNQLNQVYGEPGFDHFLEQDAQVHFESRLNEILDNRDFRWSNGQLERGVEVGFPEDGASLILRPNQFDFGEGEELNGVAFAEKLRTSGYSNEDVLRYLDTFDGKGIDSDDILRIAEIERNGERGYVVLKISQEDLLKIGQ